MSFGFNKITRSDWINGNNIVFMYCLCAVSLLEATLKKLFWKHWFCLFFFQIDMSLPLGWDLTNHMECCVGNTLIFSVSGFPEWGSWWRDGLLGEDTWLPRKRVKERERRNKINGSCLCIDWLGDRWVAFIRMVMGLPVSRLFSSLPALSSFSINWPRFWPGWFTLGGIWHYGGTHICHVTLTQFINNS